MFGLFKKKAPPPANLPDRIYVDEAILADEANDYDLTTALVDYVNEMQSSALYRRDEIPQEAMWLYHSDYYLAQVNNGGHSQFLRNSGMSEFINADIRNGLKLINATDMAACFDEMMSWVANNASEAALQDGFGTRAEELDALDSRFFALPEDKFYPKVNAWLKNSGLLQPMPKSNLKEAFAEEARLNPDFAKRKRIQKINQLQHGLTETYLGPFQIAAAGQLSKDGPLEIQHLNAGFPIGHPEGEGIIWGVATNAGVLAGYLTKDKAILAEAGRENGFSAEKPLFSCDLAAAQEMMAFAESTLAAGVAIELLSRVNRDTTFRYLAPLTQELLRDKKDRVRGAIYLGVTENNMLYQVTVEPSGGWIAPYPSDEAMDTILSPGMKRVRTEVEAHNSYTPTR